MIGYVYIMINPAFPNLIKIGRTTKLSDARASELYTTGTPGKFIVIYDELVDNCIEIEELMHLHFSNARYSDGREFFEIQPKEAIKILQTFCENRLVELSDENIESIQNNKESPNQLFYLYDIFIGRLKNRNIYRIGLLSIQESNYCDNEDEITNKLIEDLKKYYNELDSHGNIKFELKIKYFFEMRKSSFAIKNNLISKIKNLIDENIKQGGFKDWDKIYDEQTIIGPLNYFDTDFSASMIYGQIHTNIENYIDDYLLTNAENKKNNMVRNIIDSYKDII